MKVEETRAEQTPGGPGPEPGAKRKTLLPLPRSQSGQRAVMVIAVMAIAASATVTTLSIRRGWSGMQRPQAQPHRMPIIERGGKTLLWAKGDTVNLETSDTLWFDMTDALVDPKKFQYGIGKDSIPAIDDPVYVDPDDPRLIDFGILADHPIFGYEVDGIARGYSPILLGRHELVNDRFGDKPVTVGW